MPLCYSLVRRQDLPPRGPWEVHAVPEMMLPPTFETTGDPLLLIGRRGGHRGHDDRVVSFELDAFQ